MMQDAASGSVGEQPLPSGAVKLHLLGNNEASKGDDSASKAISIPRETAIFHWREGATASFVFDSLRQHGARMLQSSERPFFSSGSIASPESVLLFSSVDQTVPLTVTEMHRKIIAREFKTVLVGSSPAAPAGCEDKLPQILVKSCPQSPATTSGDKMSSHRTAFPGSRGLNVRKIDPEDESAFMSHQTSTGRSGKSFLGGLVPSFGIGGSSQVTFATLMASNKNPVSSKISAADLTWDKVAQHNKATDCWVVLNGEVFDVTRYLEFHPGGKAILLKYGGQDITAKFNHYHPWVNARHILAANYLGPIEQRGTRNRKPPEPLLTSLPPVSLEEEFEDCIESSESN